MEPADRESLNPGSHAGCRPMAMAIYQQEMDVGPVRPGNMHPMRPGSRSDA